MSCREVLVAQQRRTVGSNLTTSLRQHLSRLLVRLGSGLGSCLFGSLQNLLIGDLTFNSCIFRNSCALLCLRSLCHGVCAPVQVSQLLNAGSLCGKLYAGQLSEDCLGLLTGGLDSVQILVTDLLTANQLTDDLGALLCGLQVHALLGEQRSSGIQNLCSGVLSLGYLCLCFGLLDLGGCGRRCRSLSCGIRAGGFSLSLRRGSRRCSRSRGVVAQQVGHAQ